MAILVGCSRQSRVCQPNTHGAAAAAAAAESAGPPPLARTPESDAQPRRGTLLLPSNYPLNRRVEIPVGWREITSRAHLDYGTRGGRARKGEGDRPSRPPPNSMLALAGCVVKNTRKVEDSRQRPIGRVRYLGLLEGQRRCAAALFIEAAEAAHARSNANLVACANEAAAAAAAVAAFDVLKRESAAGCFTAVAV